MDMKFQTNGVPPKASSPVRKAIFRGLAVLAPPLLTIVIFVWVGKTVEDYVLDPVTGAVREAIVARISDIRHEPLVPLGTDTLTVDGRTYARVAKDSANFIPGEVYEKVRSSVAGRQLPKSGKDFYRAYVDVTYLRPWIVIPVFLSLFILVLYLLGKFLAAGIGRALWNALEHSITRVPLVRSVYSAVKQVVDFFFGEREAEFTRVVAIEFPRRGMWILGFAVSESFLDISAAANEPVIAVFVPTSPVPMGGFVVHLPRREVIDMNINVDQALQFIVSCGVVSPPLELQEKMCKLRQEGGMVASS